MFRQRTVFVIGAGASQDLGFPSGAGLLSAIKSRFNVDVDHAGRPQGKWDIELMRKLEARYPEPAHWVTDTFVRIRDRIAGYDSIDDLLDYSQDANISRAGKAAIVREILKCEGKCVLSHIRRHDGLDFGPLQNSWHLKFFKLLRRGIRNAELEQIFNNVSIICFNYDRCIEMFLFYCLQHFGERDADGAARILKTLRIVHPYGDVGALLQTADRPQPVSFGDERADILGLAETINTYTESVQSDIYRTAIPWIEQAEQIVFLGFGYHEPNMRFITVANQARRDGARGVYGTVFGIHGPQIPAIEARIRRALIDQVIAFEPANLGCADFFDHYSMRLTA